MKQLFEVQKEIALLWVDMWLKVVDVGMDLHATASKNVNEYVRKTVEISQGPSLTDKYGKRKGDVDPEKL